MHAMRSGGQFANLLQTLRHTARECARHLGDTRWATDELAAGRFVFEHFRRRGRFDRFVGRESGRAS